MTRIVRRIAAPAVAAIAVLAMLPAPGQAQTPLYFPRTQTLDTTLYTLRVAGIDRFATAGALARVAAQNQSTTTGYPFNEPNATADTKAYGFAACPKAVGIAAGDTVADALAASPMKDLGLLTIGGEAINTTNAVMLLTTSGRQGATDLIKETLDTLNDLRTACGSFDAIVFGGENAVPKGAADALAAVTGRVARVVGADRFETAGAIATAVHGARGPANVDYFATANTPTALPNSVFLAEAGTGADALAVGPFAASKNVPVLLTGSSGALPIGTRNALLAIRPANIIVVGGPAAVPDTVVKEATDAAGSGAKATRISGTDRYDTSVKIGQQLYNIYPITAGTPVVGTPSADYSNVVVGFARSEGSGPAHVGFPDALASAWFLDTQADQSTPPLRMAGPIEKNNDTIQPDKTLKFTTIGGTAGSRRASLLLVQRDAVPAPITTQVKAMFPSAGRNTNAAASKTAANQGGFGFVFGGPGAVAQPAHLALAELLSGGFYTAPNRTDLVAKMDPAKVFYTSMPFTGYATSEAGGVDAEGVIAEGDKVCALRNAISGSQFLALYQTGGFGSSGLVDYQDTAGKYPTFQSRFFCAAADALSSDRAQVLTISPSGHDSTPKSIDWSSADARLTVPTPVTNDKASSVTNGGGARTEITLDLGSGGSAKTTAVWTGMMPISYKGTNYSAAEYTLTLNIIRNDPPSDPPGQTPADSDDDYITFDGTLAVRSASALLFSANLVGESSTPASPFKLSGMYTTGTGAGGFRATVEAPDSATYRLSDMVLDGTA